MESRDADRSGIDLSDHVDAVTALIDASDGDAVLVGHSVGCAIAYAAADARPDRVTRLVCIGGFPTPDGSPIADAFEAVNGEVPLPDWPEFTEEDRAGLDDKALAVFRERAIPSPARVIRDRQHLSDLRRYDIPLTIICTEFTSHMLREWIAEDLAPVREFGWFGEVTYMDLPTGHWPQFSRPADLGQAILASMRSVLINVDDQGRPEPPVASSEAGTLLGFLEFQRATLEWKTRGLDAAALSATTGVSAMTLGGLLKHLSYVEDHWFSTKLHGRDPHSPWDTVDWKATPDWDWDSAAGDSPAQLRSAWQAAMARSGELVAEALAAGGLGQLAVKGWPNGDVPSLRWILVHMIEEYARHNGHADLLRESIDGEVGE